MTPRLWIAAYALAPLVALAVIAMFLQLWRMWRKHRQTRALQRAIEASERLGLYQCEDEELRSKLRVRLTQRDRAIDVDPDEL